MSPLRPRICRVCTIQHDPMHDGFEPLSYLLGVAQWLVFMLWTPRLVLKLLLYTHGSKNLFLAP